MPKSMRVKTRFTAEDDMSGTARRIEKNTRRMNRSIQRGFKRSERSAKGYKSIVKGILSAEAIQNGLGLIGQGVREVTSQFISFDDAATAAAVRFKDIGVDAKDFAEKLKIIKTAAREAGQMTLKTATESARALDEMARTGFDSATAMGALHEMIALSIASGEDLARVTKISAKLLGAFGLNVDDAAQKIKNLGRMNDVLVKTANSASVTIEDLFDTMRVIGPIASGILNVSLEEVAALTAILGDSAIDGSLAMTALKNAYLNLASPVGDGAKILKIFSISLKDGKGGVRGLTDVLQELDAKMEAKGLDPVDRAKVMDAIFGKRAIAGAKNLMSNIRNVDKFKKSLFDAGGTAKKTADIMKKSLGNELKTLNSAFLEMGFTGLDPLEKTAKSGIQKVTKKLRTIDLTPVSRELAAAFSDENVLNKFAKKLSEGAFKADSPFVQGMLDFFGEKNILLRALPEVLTNPRGLLDVAPEQNTQEEMVKMHELQSPVVNVDVNQNISSDNINVETTIKAPGGSGKVSKNNF